MINQKSPGKARYFQIGYFMTELACRPQLHALPARTSALHAPIADLDAMQEFKLCYALPNRRDTLIIPALLPPGAPPYTFDRSTALDFLFDFASFLPRHVLPELIVNRHREIHAKTVWQHGVLLKHAHSDANALVQVDYHLRTLSIWINGPDARDYLTLIRDDIHTILARLDIDFKELLALPGTARIGAPVRRASGAEHAPYQQILAYDNQGVAEYISPSGTRYNVRKVLLGYVSEENLEKERKQFIVNINNSRLGDVTVADLIDSSFNQEQPRQKTSGKSPPPVVDPGFWVDLARVFKKYRPFHKKTVSINFTNLAYLLISAPKLPRPCIGPSPV